MIECLATTPMHLVGAIVLGTLAAFVGITLLLERVIGPRVRAREEARLDRLIRPVTGARPLQCSRCARTFGVIQ